VGGFGGPLSPRWFFEGHGKVFAGEVDYDGGLQDVLGGYRPYHAHTSYAGLEGEALFAYPLTGALAPLRPFAGLGFLAWQRTLDSHGDFEPGDHGYVENWLSLYAAAGLELRSGRWQARAALRAPFYHRETIDLSEQGGDSNLELKPGRAPGYALEGGYTRNRWRFVLSYNADDFKTSDVDSSGLFLQPESERRVWSLQVAREF
jgi:hypothetical protein